MANNLNQESIAQDKIKEAEVVLGTFYTYVIGNLYTYLTN